MITVDEVLHRDGSRKGWRRPPLTHLRAAVEQILDALNNEEKSAVTTMFFWWAETRLKLLLILVSFAQRPKYGFLVSRV